MVRVDGVQENVWKFFVPRNAENPGQPKLMDKYRRFTVNQLYFRSDLISQILQGDPSFRK